MKITLHIIDERKNWIFDSDFGLEQKWPALARLVIAYFIKYQEI